MGDWTESAELERFFEGLEIRKLHTTNIRPSTKAKHEKGLATLARDQGGEKGDKRRKFSRSGKNRKGQQLLIRAKKFELGRFCFSHQALEIEMDQINGFIEIFMSGRHAISFLSGHEFESFLSDVSGDGLELVWLDFDQMQYCWL